MSNKYNFDMTLGQNISMYRYKYYNEKTLIITLGPVNVANNVKQVLYKEDIFHRERDFDCLLQRLSKMGYFTKKLTGVYGKTWLVR